MCAAACPSSLSRGGRRTHTAREAPTNAILRLDCVGVWVWVWEPARVVLETALCCENKKMSIEKRAAAVAAVSAVVAAAVGLMLYRQRRALSQSQRAVYFATSSATREHLSQELFALVKECFPDDIDEEDATDIVSCLCGFHDEESCTWLFTFDDHERVCAVAMVVSYHDRLYLSTVGVAVQSRCRGLGTLLLRSASAYAKDVLRLDRLSGSVATTHPSEASRLKRYYERLGGTALPPPPSSGALQPTTLRIDAPSGPSTACGTPPPLPLHDYTRSSVSTKR